MTMPIVSTEGYFTVYAASRVQRKDIHFPKTVDTAQRFGFRGYSTGEQNGVFRVRRGDGPLAESIDSFLESVNGQDFLAEHDLDPSSLMHVKVVSHRSDGRRVVGLLDEEKNDLYLVRVGAYKK